MVSYKDVALVYLAILMQKDENGFEDAVSTKNGHDLLESYDFIIVGGGSAGSTLANRLSEVKTWRILLMEAGGQENDFTKTPAMYYAGLGSEHDWNYTTTVQTHACKATGGKCVYPRGKALGGSSSINAMIYARGYKSDYDRWGKENSGWSFKDVEPYFLLSEDNRIPDLPNRGRKGSLTVSYPNFKTVLRDEIIKAGELKKLRNADCADYESDCILRTQSTIRDGRRCSASVAYLEPISKIRENLDIVTHAHVNKILIINKIAKGVEFIYEGKVSQVFAEREVILSAGSINSPKLLMLSGIGPKKHLESLGIEVVANLPVGEHLQDHNRVTLFYKVNNGSVENIDALNDPQQRDAYMHNQTGPYSSTGVEVLAFVRRGMLNKLMREPPNVQHHITTFLGQEVNLAGIATTVLRPKSIGKVTLKSTNPSDDPLIDVNYYGDKRDYQLTLDGMQFAHELFQSKPLKAYGSELDKSMSPQCSRIAGLSEFFECVIKYYTGTMYHPVGTAKMGKKSKNGVVDAELKVYGFDNLRVIDASITPSIISMNTNAMSIMIGEKGADIIKSANGQKSFRKISK